MFSRRFLALVSICEQGWYRLSTSFLELPLGYRNLFLPVYKMHIMTDFELKLIVRCLTDEANDDEQRELRKWLDEDENRIQYEEFKVIWMASAEIYKTYSPDLVQARKKIQEGDGSVFKLNPWMWAGKAAAILVVAVGLIWSVAKYSATKDAQSISMAKIVTGPAMDSVVLSDGSRVWLNTGTTLEYPRKFTRSERKVFLTGEAFFEVAHDAETPFIVEAGGTVTRVLGTSFNIKTGEADVLVAVRTGKVLFSEHDNTKNFALLEKNEMAAFSHSSGVIKTSVVDGAHIPSWRNTQLFFRNTPLSQVVVKLSAQYETPIQLDPAVPDSLFLTSSFDDQSVEEVLEVVCATLDLRLERTAEGYRLARAGAKSMDK
jgi:ferric-dicitrate binding protein FerR (iron transport regulator)